MAELLSIPVVLGSIRANRRSERPARLLQDRALSAGHRSELIDLRELALPMHGSPDAVVWLSPEYNHSFSAPTKNAIDYLGAQMHRKPMGVCGLSGGQMGGVRAVEQLKAVLIELQAVPIRESVYFSDAGSIFDEAGRVAREEFVRRIDYLLAELVWYARTLRWGRENVPIPERVR
jgi:NAD(P)H-dependent FMN reductase